MSSVTLCIRFCVILLPVFVTCAVMAPKARAIDRTTIDAKADQLEQVRADIGKLNQNQLKSKLASVNHFLRLFPNAEAKARRVRVSEILQWLGRQ